VSFPVLIAGLKAPARYVGIRAMSSPAVNFNSPADDFGTLLKLHCQPVWSYATVGVGKSKPSCLTLQEIPGTRIARLAHIAGIDDQGNTRPLGNDGSCAIAAIVQHHHNADALSGKASEVGCDKDTLQASPDEFFLVVGGNADANHDFSQTSRIKSASRCSTSFLSAELALISV